MVRLLVLLVICPVAAVTGIGLLIQGPGPERLLGAVLLLLAVGWFAADATRRIEQS